MNQADTAWMLISTVLVFLRPGPLEDRAQLALLRGVGLGVEGAIVPAALVVGKRKDFKKAARTRRSALLQSGRTWRSALLQKEMSS